MIYPRCLRQTRVSSPDDPSVQAPGSRQRNLGTDEGVSGLRLRDIELGARASLRPGGRNLVTADDGRPERSRRSEEGASLHLDIRDIFVDTIKDILPGWSTWLARPFFSILERWTITQANTVNLVSPGLQEYFERRYPRQRYSYFTNGIDEEFIEAGSQVDVRSPPGGRSPLNVLYAGNIGAGQGLHAVLPELARRLEGRATFRIIGDGGRRRHLEEEADKLGCTNLDILPPMERESLIEAYRKADVLFLHLNDYPAFEKVLPSKLFEHAAMGKPVWAGVAGYAASFVKEEIENAAVFRPCDVDHAVRTFGELQLEPVRRTAFLTKYARATIMKEMAVDIARLLSPAGVQQAARA